MTSPSTAPAGRRWTVLVAGLAVALGAGVTTAHGLYEVAAAAGTPPPIAWLYPLITDGLALVAYATTTRLAGHGRRYAWTVVVLAAGLSGLAQATYLAGGVTAAGPALRFGVGAWPAVAAAIAAHLLFLIGTARPTVDVEKPSVQAGPAERVQANQWPPAQSVQLDLGRGVQPSPGRAVQTDNGAADHARNGRLDRSSPASPKGRALSVALQHSGHSGSLPSARELAGLAEVSRGTAASALQQLRGQAVEPLLASDKRERSADS